MQLLPRTLQLGVAVCVSVGASFVGLNHWVSGRLDAQRASALLGNPADPLELAPPVTKRHVVEVSIDRDLEHDPRLKLATCGSFFDIRERSKDRLRIENRWCEDWNELGAMPIVTEITIERQPDGSLRGSRVQWECGGCVRMPDGSAWKSEPKPRSARVVLNRDWADGEGELVCAMYNSPDRGAHFNPDPIWYRVRP